MGMPAPRTMVTAPAPTTAVGFVLRVPADHRGVESATRRARLVLHGRRGASAGHGAADAVAAVASGGGAGRKEIVAVATGSMLRYFLQSAAVNATVARAFHAVSRHHGMAVRAGSSPHGAALSTAAAGGARVSAEQTPQAPAHQVDPRGHLACPYCSRALAVDEFSGWTGRRQLLSAACGCGRTVTMAAVTLQRRTAQ